MRTRPHSPRSIALVLAVGLGLQCNAAGPEVGEQAELGGAPTDSAQGAGLEQVDPFAPPPIGPNELLLNVTDATGDAPTGFASVRWVSSSELGQGGVEPAGHLLQRIWGMHPDLETLTAGLGRELVADALGRVALPRGRGLVLARSGELFGARAMSADAGDEAQLALAPADELVVQVLDADGTPAPGVELMFVAERPEGWVELMRFSADAADARVRFPLFGPWAAAHARGDFGPESRGVRFSLWARIPLVTPCGIFLDPAAAGSGELVLQLPPTGSVVVSAPESQSEPLHFALRHLPQEPLSTHPAMQLFADQPITAGGLGEARFERVGLGTNLHARVARVAGSAFVTANASGPQAVGEEVMLGLELRPVWARIRGRLRTPQGAPVANSSLQLVVAGSSPVDDVLYQHSLSTNRYGQFMALIDSYGELRSTRHEELRSARSVWIHSNQSEEMLVTHVELERQLDRGTHNLSVVALEPAPTLASGYVRNAAGSPVAGARIFLSAVARPLRNFERTLIEGSRFSDEQGRFDLRGFTTGEAVEVRAEHSLYGRGPWLTGAAGQTELELALPESGTISGQLVCPPGIWASELRVRAVPMKGQRALERARAFAGMVRPREDGRFEIQRLAPRTYRLTVEAPGGAAVLAEIEEVVVESGVTTRDERLEPLALPDLRQVVISIQDGANVPIGRGTLSFRPTGAGPYGRPTAFLGGRARLLTYAHELDVKVETPGWMQHESLAVRNGATLTLFRDLALRIVLEQGEHELPPGFSAALALRGLDGLLKPLAPFRPFTGLGEVLLHSDQLDAVELWWGRHHSQDPLLGYERIPGTGSVPLELQLVPGVQRFVLAPPSFEPSLGQAVTDD